MARKKKQNQYRRVTGMQDVIGEDQPYWELILNKAQTLMDLYGFERIDTPVLEYAPVFLRGVGEGTDIVEKEMYIFEDRDKEMLALRPEFTAGVMRAFIENGMHTLPTPLRVWTHGPLFRHEKSQKGRYRQHSQINLEVLGEDDPLIDAELISLAWLFFAKLGLKDLSLHIHSTGDAECRPRYLQALVDYFSKYEADLPADDKRRLKQNPLRILDTKEEKTQALFHEAPRFSDYLNAECKRDFEQLQMFLTTMGLPFQVDFRLVRGFDYYTKTVFEIKATGSLGAQDTICGGGRYDGLIETLGGRPTPGIGFGTGIERIVLTMKDQEVSLPKAKGTFVYIAYLGAAPKQIAAQLAYTARKGLVPVVLGSGNRSLKSQLKSADRANADYVVIIGEDEMEKNEVLVRNLRTREQEYIDITSIAEWLMNKSSIEGYR